MSQTRLTSLEDKMPLSPHLTIYKPQITSMLSILHRITGFFLYVGALFLVWWFVAIIYDIDVITQYVQHPIGLFLVFGWVWMLFYHLLNGIRHLVWDMGHGFEIHTVNRTGMLVLVLSLVLAVLCWYAPEMLDKLDEIRYSMEVL